MKVVARKGEGHHEVVLELWMTRDQATQVLADHGRPLEDLEEMAAETLGEHLKGLRICQRIRMNPKHWG